VPALAVDAARRGGLGARPLEPDVAAAVGTAIFGAGTVAASLGMLLPWWLARVGRDPALGSRPAATVIQDVVSLLVYFAVVRTFGI
jgi:magnesium transporter